MDDTGWEQRMAERAHLLADAQLMAELEEQGKYKSPEECWAAYPDECRACHEPRLTNPLHGWVLWMVCDYRACTHQHHEGEVLIG